MTDIMDESISWEQRREMRRKKRQELLEEADRLVQKTEAPASRSSRHRVAIDDDDEFEKERQRRRREREERRKKEREELEQQLKEQEEQRAERERRREERRRLREESELEESPFGSYTSRTTISKTVETSDDKDEHKETTEVVMETTEVVEREYPIENGHGSEEEDKSEEVEQEIEVEEQEEPEMEEEEQKYVAEEPDVEEEEEEQTYVAEEPEVEEEEQKYVAEEADVEEEEQEEELEPEEEQNGRTESEPEEEVQKTTYSSSISTSKSTTPREVEDDTDEVKQKLSELKLKRERSSQKKYASADDDYNEEEHKAKLKMLEEKRKLREQKEREEAEQEKEEAAKREAERQERLRVEREERERRRAEAEAKRQAYKKQLSEDQDIGATPLSPKNLNSPLVSKVEQLNKHITESPKTPKAASVQNVGKLDSRLEKYTKQVTKQEVKKSGGTPGRVGDDVSNRRNRWERGDVISSEKQPAKKEAVATLGDVSSRKNMWESRRGGSAIVRSTRIADEVKGAAGLSSRKDQWLKLTQQDNVAKKSESPVGMRTGVLNRLNQWEKGEVTGATPAEKAKAKAGLPASGVGDRRAKWESISTDSPKTQASQKKPNVVVASDVSNRKNLFESKGAPQQKSEPEKAKSSSRREKREEAEEERSRSEDNRYESEEELSLHSSDQEDDPGNDESYLYDDE